LGLHGSVALDEVLWPIRPLPSVPLTDATHFYVFVVDGAIARHLCGSIC